jgi:predicted secreted hydrolase
MKSMRWVFVAALIATLAMVACGHNYYQVKDPTTGNMYYTKEVHEENGGVIRFDDGRTGSEVRLSNSEVLSVSKEAYEENTRKTE